MSDYKYKQVTLVEVPVSPRFADVLFKKIDWCERMMKHDMDGNRYGSFSL